MTAIELLGRPSSVPVVMGIVNVTPDSFSDGGVHFDRDRAIEAALAMERDGAAIIDVGGESTRPGADPVAAEVELERVIPVIEGIRSRSDVTISIDTMKASVARAAIAAGAGLVNDVTALRHDGDLAEVVRVAAVPVILMHMRGEPRTMQQTIGFENLMSEIGAELQQFAEGAVRRGIAREQIFVDPGIGFGKTFDQNVEILARARELVSIAPLVLGASRKGFLGHLTGREAAADRTAGSLAAVAAATMAGASIVRVHDVRETVDFLRVWAPIARRRAEASAAALQDLSE